MSKHKKLFTSSGTWTCPAGVTLITLTGCGGGGGGGGGEDGTDAFTRTRCSGGGGGGAQVHRMSLTVTPGVVYEAWVGAGGAGGARAATTASNGSDGGDGYFKIQSGATLANFIGASHGRGGDSTQSRFTSGGLPVRGYRRMFKIDVDNVSPTWYYSRFWDQIPGAGGHGFDYNGFGTGYDGDTSFSQLEGIPVGGGTGGFPGGDGTTSGSAANGRGAGGGGCSSWYGSTGGNGGNGGNAAPGGNTSGGNATSGGAGTGYGAGGGGGGMGGNKNGSGTAGQGGNGGAGSSGFLLIEWDT